MSDSSSESSFEIEEKFIPLIGDSRFQEGVKTICELSSEVLNWLQRREDTLKLLKDLKKQIEESYQKRCISKVAGASAATVGSVLGIVGFGLSFVTFGASLGLLIPGAIIGGAGAVTMAGADIGDWLVSRSLVQTAQQAIDRDRKSFAELKEKAEKLKENVEKLAEDYPAFSKETILRKLWTFGFKGTQGVKMFYDGIRISDGAADVVRAIFGIGRFASGARTAFSGLSIVAQGFSIAGVVFDAVAIPLDLFIIIKGSYDIYKYKSGKGSNSNKANQLSKMIEALEEHRDKIMNKNETDTQDDLNETDTQDES